MNDDCMFVCTCVVPTCGLNLNLPDASKIQYLRCTLPSSLIRFSRPNVACELEERMPIFSRLISFVSAVRRILFPVPARPNIQGITYTQPYILKDMHTCIQSNILNNLFFFLYTQASRSLFWALKSIQRWQTTNSTLLSS